MMPAGARFSAAQCALLILCMFVLLCAADAALAQEQLANAEAALAAAASRAKAMHEHKALLEKAFRLGERSLADVLRSRALSHEADVALRQQRVALGLAHAQLNQARGLLP